MPFVFIMVVLTSVHLACTSPTVVATIDPQGKIQKKGGGGDWPTFKFRGFAHDSKIIIYKYMYYNKFDHTPYIASVTSIWLRLGREVWKCAWPTLFPYPCGGGVLTVESNYDIWPRGFLKNCSLPELSKNFLLKHTTEIPYFINIRRTEVNFYNPFGENFIHNIRLSLYH